MRRDNLWKILNSIALIIKVGMFNLLYLTESLVMVGKCIQLH